MNIKKIIVILGILIVLYLLFQQIILVSLMRNLSSPEINNAGNEAGPTLPKLQKTLIEANTTKYTLFKTMLPVEFEKNSGISATAIPGIKESQLCILSGSQYEYFMGGGKKIEYIYSEKQEFKINFYCGDTETLPEEIGYYSELLKKQAEAYCDCSIKETDCRIIFPTKT
ncbi:MAG: hypothetical protein ABIA76_04855 [Candidatus Diapherotrites archaeon]